jgi:uncharacterized protein YlxW (UPF0749 family)
MAQQPTQQPLTPYQEPREMTGTEMLAQANAIIATEVDQSSTVVKAIALIPKLYTETLQLKKEKADLQKQVSDLQTQLDALKAAQKKVEKK